ncbi:hypothetical protein [Nannocystis pusilla]|uniref:hypothetical protein n=1 Tax=Nannocystis pusilla TaxID=889268 RepID=UPI003DA5A59C
MVSGLVLAQAEAAPEDMSFEAGDVEDPPLLAGRDVLRPGVGDGVAGEGGVDGGVLDRPVDVRVGEEVEADAGGGEADPDVGEGAAEGQLRGGAEGVDHRVREAVDAGDQATYRAGVGEQGGDVDAPLAGGEDVAQPPAQEAVRAADVALGADPDVAERAVAAGREVLELEVLDRQLVTESGDPGDAGGGERVEVELQRLLERRRLLGVQALEHEEGADVLERELGLPAGLTAEVEVERELGEVGVVDADAQRARAELGIGADAGPEGLDEVDDPGLGAVGVAGLDLGHVEPHRRFGPDVGEVQDPRDLEHRRHEEAVPRDDLVQDDLGVDRAVARGDQAVRLGLVLLHVAGPQLDAGDGGVVRLAGDEVDDEVGPPVDAAQLEAAVDLLVDDDGQDPAEGGVVDEEVGDDVDDAEEAEEAEDERDRQLDQEEPQQRVLAPDRLRRGGEPQDLRMQGADLVGVGERVEDQRLAQLTEAVVQSRIDVGAGDVAVDPPEEVIADPRLDVVVDRLERLEDDRRQLGAKRPRPGEGDPVGEPQGALDGLLPHASPQLLAQVTARSAQVAGGDPPDQTLALQVLVGVEEEGEVRPAGEEVAEATAVAQPFEAHPAVSEEIGLPLPCAARCAAAGHVSGL